jgi:hypothetical protein
VEFNPTLKRPAGSVPRNRGLQDRRPLIQREHARDVEVDLLAIALARQYKALIGVIVPWHPFLCIAAERFGH